MASAPPVEHHRPTAIARVPGLRRARIAAVCAALALIAVVVGLVAGATRHGPADAADAITNSAVVATARPDAPTPTPLANRPTATALPAPTATVPPAVPTAQPANPPPPVAAPPVQPVQRAPVSAPPNHPGKGKGKEKDKGDD